MYAPQNDLGSLSSFLKKAVKTAGKLSPSRAIAKAISPKLLKLSPSQALASKLEGKKKPKVSSAPKTPPAEAVAPPPVTQTSPAAVDLSQIANQTQQPFSFGGGGGGGGGPSQPYTDIQPAEAAATDYTPWMIGGAALIGAWFLFGRKRR